MSELLTEQQIIEVLRGLGRPAEEREVLDFTLDESQQLYFEMIEKIVPTEVFAQFENAIIAYFHLLATTDYSDVEQDQAVETCEIDLMNELVNTNKLNDPNAGGGLEHTQYGCALLVTVWMNKLEETIRADY